MSPLRVSLRRHISPLGILAYVILTIWAVIALLPLIWMTSTALKESKITLQFPPAFIPVLHKAQPMGQGGVQNGSVLDKYTFVPTTANFTDLFARAPVVRWFFNSAVLACLHTTAMLLFCSMAGYAFAKKRFPGKDILFWLLLSTMMIPGVVLLVPLFLMVSRFGLTDTYAGLVLPGMVGAFGVFLMKQFIQTLPTDLIEAANIEGASEIRIFTQIVLPLSKPSLAVLGIFSFMGSWNDFLWPLLITQSKSMRTLAVGLATLQQESMSSYGLLMAGSVVAAIPMIIAFFALQKYFIKGLTIGAVKG